MQPPAAKSSGAPGWMVTFADLMALMMTFFVLLYSFSKIDEAKYREIVNALGQGFGAQWVRKSMNTSQVGPEAGIVAPPVPTETPTPAKKPKGNWLDSQAALLAELRKVMAKEIDAGLVSMVADDKNVIIRFPERVAFASGSATINADFGIILDPVGKVLRQTRGQIKVAGHTDDQPIATPRFRSNWELSAARAVSLLHLLQEHEAIDPKRLTAVGHADTRPLAPNTTPDNRAKNRRVEIVVSDLKLGDKDKPQ
jgi:chemotaxis protein MotB